jgi:hypothetical protein
LAALQGIRGTGGRSFRVTSQLLPNAGKYSLSPKYLQAPKYRRRKLRPIVSWEELCGVTLGSKFREFVCVILEAE